MKKEYEYKIKFKALNPDGKEINYRYKNANELEKIWRSGDIDAFIPENDAKIYDVIINGKPSNISYKDFSDFLKSLNIYSNTKIEYLYRDADNYKKYNSVVLSGRLSKEETQEIIDSLDSDGEFLFFIPRQVGLPEERFDKLSSADHCWFEFCDIQATGDEPTIDMPVHEMLENFRQVKRWDDVTYAVVEFDEEEKEWE